MLAIGASIVVRAPQAIGQDLNCNPPNNTDEDWRIGGIATCMNRTIIVRNLSILWGAQVTLRNVTLIIDADIDASAGEGQGVRVWGTGEAHSAGGVLEIYDSLLRPLTNDKRALADVGDGAIGHFIRTTFQNFRVITGGEVRDFLMEDSNFVAEGRRARGINTFNYGNYRFIGNFITNVDEIVAGRNIFENNTITNCGTGISIYNADVPIKVTHNTITDCASGIGGPGCTPFTFHHNDIFDNGRKLQPGYGSDSAACGDGRSNWWGHDPPTPQQFQLQPGETFNYTPWLTEPVHPERLPRPSLTGLPTSLSVNQTVSLDARASQPSTRFNIPLTSYEWDLGNGQTRTGPTIMYAYPDRGTFNVTLRVVDSMGLSRSITASVTVTNRPPTVDPIRFEPNPPVDGQDLRAYVTAQDPDGDTVHADSYRWSLNGTLVPELNNRTFVPDVQDGQEWRLVVMVRDDDGATATTEATITVPPPDASAMTATTAQEPSPKDHEHAPPESYSWTPIPSQRPPQRFDDPIPTPSRHAVTQPASDRAFATNPEPGRSAASVGLFLAFASLTIAVVARRQR